MRALYIIWAMALVAYVGVFSYISGCIEQDLQDLSTATEPAQSI